MSFQYRSPFVSFVIVIFEDVAFMIAAWPVPLTLLLL